MSEVQIAQVCLPRRSACGPTRSNTDYTLAIHCVLLLAQVVHHRPALRALTLLLLAQMARMGFGRDQALAALAEADNDIHAAINIALSAPPAADRPVRAPSSIQNLRPPCPPRASCSTHHSHSSIAGDSVQRDGAPTVDAPVGWRRRRPRPRPGARARGRPAGAAHPSLSGENHAPTGAAADRKLYINRPPTFSGDCWRPDRRHDRPPPRALRPPEGDTLHASRKSTKHPSPRMDLHELLS